MKTLAEPTINDPWIGVDLDGTLAIYHGWVAYDVIGPPIDSMVARIKHWLANGRTVKIFTARVSYPGTPEDMALIIEAIEDWCLRHIGVILPITCTKDLGMIELWDDRCVRVVTNQGCICCDYMAQRKDIMRMKKVHKVKPLFAPPLRTRRRV